MPLDLETRILNRLRTRKRGQTLAQLRFYLSLPEETILVVLQQLRKEGRVALVDGTVWILLLQP